VNRIFLVQAIFGNALLVGAFALGWMISDAGSLAPEARAEVNRHMFVSLGAAILVLLVHAVALTYFMGTGRWIEETCEAYSLGTEQRKRNIRLKYQAIPGMVLAMVLVIITGAFGAMADPGSNTRMASAATIHFTLAIITLCVNLLACALEYDAIRRNGLLVDAVVADVRRIRREQGLD
jgi:hypothetical protein